MLPFTPPIRPQKKPNRTPALIALSIFVFFLFAVIFLFLFSYGILNHSVEKWFSRPAEDVEYRTNIIASLLTEYAATNARDEAARIAATPDAQKSFHTGRCV